MIHEIILFVLGAIVGSFLNVLALRYNSGLSLGGRSHCSSCGKKLEVLELVPILSFLCLKGRCRSCLSKISFQYPLVEIWTGLVFATLFNPILPIWANILMLAIFSLYIAITVYDLRHQIIPDGLVYASIALAIVFRILSGGEMLDYLSGPILFLCFSAVWLISRGQAMGFGDGKLVLSVGLALGAAAGFSGAILSFWIGAAFGLILLIFSRFYPLSGSGKQITIKSAIPFAPFIVIGAWLAQFWHLDLLHVSLF